MDFRRILGKYSSFHAGEDLIDSFFSKSGTQANAYERFEVIQLTSLAVLDRAVIFSLVYTYEWHPLSAH